MKFFTKAILALLIFSLVLSSGITLAAEPAEPELMSDEIIADEPDDDPRTDDSEVATSVAETEISSDIDYSSSIEEEFSSESTEEIESTHTDEPESSEAETESEEEPESVLIDTENQELPLEEIPEESLNAEEESEELPEETEITETSADEEDLELAEAETEDSESINGFQYKDKKWGFYKKGKLQSSLTGMVKGTINGVTTWYYVKKGIFTKDTGLVKKADDADRSWYYVYNGAFKKAYGLVKKADDPDRSWYYIKSGMFVTATGMSKKADSSDTKWYYVKNGTFSKSTCLTKKTYSDDPRTFYVKDGVFSAVSGKVTINGKQYILSDGVRLKKGDGIQKAGSYIVVAGKLVSVNAKTLDLSNIDIAWSGINMNKLFKLLPNLKKIYMIDCGLTNAQYAKLQDNHPNVKIVWVIRLSHWKIRTDAVGFSTFKTTTDNFFFTNADAYYLRYCTDLVGLDLGHNMVTDLSFLKYMPNLKVLILVDNWGYTASGQRYRLSDLSMLKYVPKLQYLEVFVSGASNFNFMKNLPDMVDLNISYSRANSIAPFMNMKHLERMWLEHTNISYSDYLKLVKRYPNAKIVYYGTGSIDQGWRTGSHYKAMRNLLKYNYVPALYK